jgi:hemerythrin
MTKLLTWEERYATGIEHIDEQHLKIFTILNSLFEALQEGREQDIIQPIITELVLYANFHFSFEETYFAKFHYEDTEAHIKEHQYYRDSVGKFANDSESKDLMLSYNVLDFLEDWWINHIMGTDHKYIKCFKEHGLS